jgi:hypothetical protein
MPHHVDVRAPHVGGNCLAVVWRILSSDDIVCAMTDVIIERTECSHFTARAILNDIMSIINLHVIASDEKVVPLPVVFREIF